VVKFAKILGILAVPFVLLAAVGALYQGLQMRADREMYPPPGDVLTVDGVALHLHCQGEGWPVVVLEAGLTSGSTSWGIVPSEVAGHTRTCAYDRSGMDWSPPVDQIVTTDRVVSRLGKLLERAGVDGPYLLVGMSAGGLYVRKFAEAYPHEVAGMVLVDSSHEQQGARLPAPGGSARMAQALRACGWLQPFGIVRLSGALDMLAEPYPEPMRGLVRANANQSHGCRAVLAEIQSFEQQLNDGAHPPRSLGDLPLTVLSQGGEPRGDEMFGISDAQAREMRAIWDLLQQELAALSSRGRHLIARDSGHLIQLEQPQLVIDAIVDMIGELRESAGSAGKQKGAS
jgi:pimeloyl-ACP methyl ester carboxylesterase